MSDLISRQSAISLPPKPKEDRYFQTQNLDDAYDYGWRDLQECIEKLPPAQPDYTAIKYEIQRNIDDFHNSEHHAQHVLSNGRMIAFGLELALDIVKDAERGTDGDGD